MIDDHDLEQANRKARLRELRAYGFVREQIELRMHTEFGMTPDEVADLAALVLREDLAAEQEYAQTSKIDQRRRLRNLAGVAIKKKSLNAAAKTEELLMKIDGNEVAREAPAHVTVNLTHAVLTAIGGMTEDQIRRRARGRSHRG